MSHQATTPMQIPVQQPFSAASNTPPICKESTSQETKWTSAMDARESRSWRVGLLLWWTGRRFFAPAIISLGLLLLLLEGLECLGESVNNGRNDHYLHVFTQRFTWDDWDVHGHSRQARRSMNVGSLRTMNTANQHHWQETLEAAPMLVTAFRAWIPEKDRFSSSSPATKEGSDDDRARRKDQVLSLSRRRRLMLRSGGFHGLSTSTGGRSAAAGSALPVRSPFPWRASLSRGGSSRQRAQHARLGLGQTAAAIKNVAPSVQRRPPRASSLTPESTDRRTHVEPLKAASLAREDGSAMAPLTKEVDTPKPAGPESLENAIAEVYHILTAYTGRGVERGPVEYNIKELFPKDKNGEMVPIHPSLDDGICGSCAFAQAVALLSEPGLTLRAVPYATPEQSFLHRIVADFGETFGFAPGTGPTWRSPTYRFETSLYADDNPSRWQAYEEGLLDIMEDGQIALVHSETIAGSDRVSGHASLAVRLGKYMVHINNQYWKHSFSSFAEFLRIFAEAADGNLEELKDISPLDRESAITGHDIFVLAKAINPLHLHYKGDMAGVAPYKAQDPFDLFYPK